MRLTKVLTVVCLALLTSSAMAAGRVSVHGYTKANGTHVAPYTRAAPGSKGQPAYVRSEGGDAGGGAAIEDNPNWSAGLGGPKARPDPKATGCVYSDVMTDDQIAACRKH